ncbi:MAG: MFS transporter [Cypionkella sp.]
MTAPSLWKNRSFQLVFSASSFTNLGDGVLAVAFPWFATLLTRDPLLIGLVAAARQLPWLLFALPAGVLADRFDRRNLILLADACRLLLALAAVALALSETQGTGAVLLLTALCFALGAAEVVRDNTAQSFLPNLVSKSQLEQANGLLWSTEQLAGQFIGPPLAGYLIGFAIFLPFGIEAAFLALAIALIAAIRLPKAAAQPRQAFGPALREGLSWLWSHQSLRRLALVLGAYNFIGSMFYALLVLYAQDVLGLDAFGYGQLMAIQAAGGLAASLAGPWILRRIGSTLGLLSGLSAFTLCAAVMGVSANFWLIAALLLAEAFGNMLWNIASVSYRQRIIPDALLGRVNAAFRFFGTGPSALGSVAGGLVVVMGARLGQTAALHLLYAVIAALAASLLVYSALRLRLIE